MNCRCARPGEEAPRRGQHGRIGGHVLACRAACRHPRQRPRPPPLPHDLQRPMRSHAARRRAVAPSRLQAWPRRWTSTRATSRGATRLPMPAARHSGPSGVPPAHLHRTPTCLARAFRHLLSGDGAGGRARPGGTAARRRRRQSGRAWHGRRRRPPAATFFHHRPRRARTARSGHPRAACRARYEQK